MKKLLLLFAVFAVSTLAQNATSIRVFHGVAGGPNVDVYFNSISDANLIARNVSPGNVSDYRNITGANEQNTRIIVTQAGSTTNIIANQTANLSTVSKAATILVVPSTSAGNTSAGANATSANTTSGASINLVVLNDQFGNGQPAPQNTSLLRFVNVANTTGANATSGNTTSGSVFSLRLNNGTVLFSNVNFLDTNTNYIALPPGNYNMELVGASGQPIATDQVNLAAGQALTLFAFVPAAAAAPTLIRGTDTSGILFVPPVAPGTGVATAAVTSGIATSGAVTSGAVTSGAVTSGAVTSGAVTSGAATSGVATTAAPATTGVIITGFTSGIQRPVNAAGTLRCDVATLGVVCALLFTVFYRRE